MEVCSSLRPLKLFVIKDHVLAFSGCLAVRHGIALAFISACSSSRRDETRILSFGLIQDNGYELICPHLPAWGLL